MIPRAEEQLVQSASEMVGRHSSGSSYPLVDGMLYRLGGTVPLDDRLSFASAEAGRYIPINCYLAIEKEGAYLIDTGVALHRQAVISQLKDTLPQGLPLTVSITRPEFECTGNLGAVHTAVPIEEIIIGGMRNPFDAYDDISREVNVPTKRQRLASTTSAVNPLGTSRRLLLISPRLRVLTTYWLYDKGTKTLFSSDVFGHASVGSADASPIVDDETDDMTTVDSLKRQLLAKFPWLSMAYTGELIRWISGIFDKYEVEIIAPTHGCVLKGPRVVRRHFDMFVRVLENLDRSPK
jgi:flavorubredoxin